MASTQIHFSYPTYSNQNTQDSYDDYSDEDYSDYENEIEYSLEQQDKLEWGINGGGRMSGSSGSSKKTSNINTNATKPAANTTKVSPTPSPSSSNQIKSVEQILDEIEQKQELKNKKPEIEKTQKLSSSEKEEILKRETENVKKERLPSSEEVYNRIKWEFSSKVEDFSILYEDRFDGLISASFKDFEYDVIPSHRIQMFKYKDFVIYSRKERIYNFNDVYKN
ncbi:hypothetical protein DICPUDRAFT_81210 [Dictyostelium purpureum]|uniref:MJ1316 RNA cyclic group end recognition domain-containing protein n=1 Tax=Dictyostelium purpureum TaxID=5786 RepID=F0ZST8_DICPU|nr:uncharacterized protein DICPUDRAFT_81210 [Dictyostelium purpureum]EGC33003.1 hypothetical protein DICPUDRAFT_81210 [Dictyostelium purpureum]|eukprot:XP_003290473.1 hypothetical protein DICPUDRAFT_81210 [Dictyostelium purpureum]